MHAFHVLGILTTLAALFAYLNHRFLRLPMTVGLMLQSLLLAGVLFVADRFGLEIEARVAVMVESLRFDELVLEVILSFLLFSGALFVRLDELADLKLDIALLVVAGVLLSTVLAGFAVYGLALWLGVGLRLTYCLLFGALISPTDPVAVLAILKKAGIGGADEARLAGEALFNDGVGIVLFLSLLRVAGGEGDFGFGGAALLFAREALGGVAFGFFLGGAGYLLLRGIDDYPVEILITVAMVTGGYTLAHQLHVSGPLAMVVSGLMIGSRGRKMAMSEKTIENLDRFWEVVEDIINAVLFTVIGLEVLLLFPGLAWPHLLPGLVAIPVVLLARFLAVGGIALALVPVRALPRRSIPLLVWGGVRGGVSIALALSVPEAPERTTLIVATYLVAVFTLLVQAPTVGLLLRRR